MKQFNQYWILIAGTLLVQTVVGATNINGNGVSLNLSTTDLSSVAIQSNNAWARLVAAGTPASGIVSTNGTEAKVIIEPMRVINADDTPAADFSATPLTGSAPLEVQFFDLSSGGVYEILSWMWDFGDGSPYSSDQDPVHTYDIPGTYTVSLTLLTTGGPAYAARLHYITVMHAMPAVDWTVLLLLIMIVVLTGTVLIYKKCIGY